MYSSRLVIVAAMLLSAVACGGGYSTPSTPSAPTTSPAPAPGASSSSVAIPSNAAVLGNSAYNPDDLHVTAGTSVTWTNTDSTAHTSTSDATGWNSGIIGPGERFSVAFQTPGTFHYHCTIHPGMVGTVIVQ